MPPYNLCKSFVEAYMECDSIYVPNLDHLVHFNSFPLDVRLSWCLAIVWGHFCPFYAILPRSGKLSLHQGLRRGRRVE